MTWSVQFPSTGRHAQPVILASAALLLAPAVMLAIAAGHLNGTARSLSIGVGVTLAVEGLYLLTRYGHQRASEGLIAVAFYAIAALMLRFNSPDPNWSLAHAMLAATMLVPIGLLVRREVVAIGGNARRVKFLIRQLLAKRDWPISFEEYRKCPIIRGLRDGVRENAAPVLPLLSHDDMRIQVAALTALEFHSNWRRGQPEAVLRRVSFSDQPAVRAAAMLALANVHKIRHVHAMVPYMCDASEEVRRAAAIAVLWDAGKRWTDIRGQIRYALAAPHAARDGPLPCSGLLPKEALDDLVTWACESGAVGKRATQTLVRHCKKVVLEDGSPEAIGRLTALVANPRVPAGIRVEFAHKLQSADLFPPDIAARLLGPANPTMLRVLAAGALLSERRDPQAIQVLREAAKQPNREITMAAASLVQKYLGVDLGLAVGGELPPTNTREAAEITRRVLQWASDPDSQLAAETPADVPVASSDVAYF